MKALKRARQQAAERGETLASAVADRHGSLAQLTQGLSERSAAPGECRAPCLLTAAAASASGKTMVAWRHVHVHRELAGCWRSAVALWHNCLTDAAHYFHVEVSKAPRVLPCAARAHLHAAHSRKAASQPQEETGTAKEAASKDKDGRRIQQDRQRGPRADYLTDVGGPKMRAPQSGTGFGRR